MAYFTHHISGWPNKCEETGRVVLSDNIEVAEVEVGEQMEMDIGVDAVGSLTEVVVDNLTDVVSRKRLSSAFEAEEIDDYGVEQAFHIEHSYGNVSFCPENINDPYNKALDRYIVSKSRQRLTETFGNELLDLPWATLRYFNNSWMEFMKTYLSDRMPLRTIEKSHRNWFFLMVNETHPLFSRFACWFCITWYEMVPLTELSFWKPDIVKLEGHAISASRKQNRRAINDHSVSKTHLTITSFVQKEYAKRFNSELFANIQRGQDLLEKRNRATNIAMRSAYFLNRMVWYFYVKSLEV